MTLDLSDTYVQSAVPSIGAAQNSALLAETLSALESTHSLTSLSAKTIPGLCVASGTLSHNHSHGPLHPILLFPVIQSLLGGAMIVSSRQLESSAISRFVSQEK